MPAVSARNVPAVAIRRARPKDKRAVREIVQTVWGGNDYLPAVFDDWVRDRRGGLFVAVVGGELVGVGKLTALSDEEGWLEGLRVAPRRRRQGIAELLVRYRMDRARALGLRVVRLATAEENVAVRRLAIRMGMRRAAVLVAWRARASADAGEAAQRARARDLLEVWRLFSGGPLRTGAHLAKVQGRWAWRELQRRELMREIAEGRCLVARLGQRVSAAAMVHPAGETLVVSDLVGSVSGRRQLLARLPSEAQTRGAATVQLLLPRNGLTRSLASAGFVQRPGASWIYEHRLNKARKSAG